MYLLRNASHVILEHRCSSASHVPRFRTIENRFAIGISSHMISATKAIWIPLRLYGFYSHERHALIPISSVFISRESNLGSHVARYSISTKPEVEARKPGTFVDRLHLGRRSELPKLGHSRTIIGTSDG